MPFSRGAIFGSQLGAGLNQGFNNQYQFENLLNKANRLSHLPQDQQSLALALMGGQKGSAGNPLDAIIAAIVAQQFGMGQPGMPSLPNTGQPTQAPTGGKTIRVKDKASGQPGTIPESEFDPKLYDRI